MSDTDDMLAEAQDEYAAAWHAHAAAEARLKAATRRVLFRQLRTDIESAFGPLDQLNEEVTTIWPNERRR